MSYLNHAINESPVITGEAGAAITAPAMKAVAFDTNGQFVLPTASSIPVGIVLATKVDVAKGDRLDVQYKDICYAIAGETIARGDALKAHTDGTLKKASTGDAVFGIALGGASANNPVEIMIVRTTL